MALHGIAWHCMALALHGIAWHCMLCELLGCWAYATLTPRPLAAGCSRKAGCCCTWPRTLTLGSKNPVRQGTIFQRKRFRVCFLLLNAAQAPFSNLSILYLWSSGKKLLRLKHRLQALLLPFSPANPLLLFFLNQGLQLATGPTWAEMAMGGDFRDTEPEQCMTA